MTVGLRAAHGRSGARFGLRAAHGQILQPGRLTKADELVVDEAILDIVELVLVLHIINTQDTMQRDERRTAASVCTIKAVRGLSS